MKPFTATSLQRNSSSVFNEVQSSGIAVIESKSRPDMVIMTRKYMNEMVCKLAADLTKKK